MAESFDSWKGFLDAGFVADDNGSLHLGDHVAEYVVSREGRAIKVRFESEVPGHERIEFDLPAQFNDMYEWAACIAGRTFGTCQGWKRFFDLVTDVPDQDLMQLVEIGLGHLDETPHLKGDGKNDSEDDQQEDEDAAFPSEEENDVVSEYEISEGPAEDAERETWPSRLRKVVDAALEEAWRALSDSARAKDIERSQTIMDRVNRLKMLSGKIAEVAAEWEALGLEDVAFPVRRGRSPRPTEPTDAPEGGSSGDGAAGSDDAVPVPKGSMGFAVVLADGVRIAEAKASTTFAKAIEKIGAERVAALGIKMADDPLVTRNKAEIRKMPMMVQSISDGWFVKTHSNTYTKIQFLKRIAEALNVEMKFETFRREKTEKVVRKRRGRPRKRTRHDQNEFQIGRVVKWYFPKVFDSNAVTDDEIALFLSDESKRRFGTRGCPVLKETNGSNDDGIVNGHRRYYGDLKLLRKDRAYLLTSQFITAESGAILSWLEGKGYSRTEMDRIGRGEETVPSLFPGMTCFKEDLPIVDESQTDDEGASSGRLDELEPEIPVESADVEQESVSFSSDIKMTEETDPSETPSIVREAGGGIAAYTVKKSLRKEMQRLSYTPKSLALGLKLPVRLVKGWYKGRGIISASEYDALCKHLAIEGLKQQ